MTSTSTTRAPNSVAARAVRRVSGSATTSSAPAPRRWPHSGRPTLPRPRHEYAVRGSRGGVARRCTHHREDVERRAHIVGGDVASTEAVHDVAHGASAAVHSAASWPPHSPYYSARLLLERHGARAVVHVAKELADCQASGDGDGYAEWGEIADAIEDLQEH